MPTQTAYISIEVHLMDVVTDKERHYDDIVSISSKKKERPRRAERYTSNKFDFVTVTAALGE